MWIVIHLAPGEHTGGLGSIMHGKFLLQIGNCKMQIAN